jgi:hypothetical protein
VWLRAVERNSAKHPRVQAKVAASVLRDRCIQNPADRNAPLAKSPPSASNAWLPVPFLNVAGLR